MVRFTLFRSVAVAALVVLGLGGVAQAAPSTGAGIAAATAGCGKAPLASGNHNIQSGGQTRSYILRVPNNYDNTRQYRLFVGLHWRGGSSNDVDSGGTDGYNWSYYGLRRLADNAGNGTIFVAPNGNGGGWANPNGQDVTFIDDMLRNSKPTCVWTPHRSSRAASATAPRCRTRSPVPDRRCSARSWPTRART
ncbi:hypothetical protein GCM10029964_064000 [Kibdelosporangium lantanae]